jgi:hypothetical protein
MTIALVERFRAWDAVENDPDLEPGALSLVLYLAKRVYGDYEPSGFRPFMLRLEKWLGNVESDADQKLLVSLLSHLFFAGRGEFESLYRSTLTNVYRWLADVTPLDIADPNLSEALNSRLSRTWICPITDSLRINSFLKVNEISGHDHRPHWRSLAEFGDVCKIQQYIDSKMIERLVLVEDFVGSGTQIASTVDFVCANFGGLQVALCPLMVCPVGDERLAAVAAKYRQLTYMPTMVLPEEVFLGPTPKADEPTTFTRGRELINRVAGRLITDAFGYLTTGAMVALFSNCPDNTLAIFRDEADNWEPLFPRVWRPE